MKKLLLNHFLVLLCFFSSLVVHAQNINVITNPTATGSFMYSVPGPFSGYAGNAIALGSSLVLEYNNGISSDTSLTTIQLAVYNGSSTTLITNPDAGHGVYWNSVQLVHNDSLFFIYLDVSNKQRLASFNGTAITLYPNPDGGLGYLGSPRIYNNTLYVAYSNATGITQFGKFTGAGISLIPNPDAGSFFNDYAVIFNNKICSRYITADGSKHLANYDGASWTVLPNPDASTRGVYPDFPAVYDNKLYWIYFSTVNNQYQYLQYDGTGSPVLLTNPEDESATGTGVAGLPVVLNDTFFFQYQDQTGTFRLAKFGGTAISLVPDPDASPYGFYNTPIVYNNNLYIFYVTPDQLHHLAQYVSNGDSLKVYPNPDAGNGYWDQPIVYDNKLFFQYYNVSGVFQPGYFDGGSSLNLIANPAGNYTGAAGNNGYTGYPVLWNSLLYMQFGGVPYANAGNLASFDASALPISLLSFSVQKSGNTSLLKWKTANEINNAYFSIEHSKDGRNFQPIGKMAGHGTVSTQQAYQFIDNTPAKGLNFYRLKQVDLDGNFTYSTIETVTFDNITIVFKIFPNPAGKNVYITIPPVSGTSVLHIFDGNGRKVMEKLVGANTTPQPMDVSSLAKGIYQLTLIQGDQQQTISLIKE